MHRHLIWPNAKCLVSAEPKHATGDLLHLSEDVRDHFLEELFVGRLLVVGLLFILLFLPFLLSLSLTMWWVVGVAGVVVVWGGAGGGRGGG